jgi:hypothetical protein
LPALSIADCSYADRVRRLDPAGAQEAEPRCWNELHQAHKTRTSKASSRRKSDKPERKKQAVGWKIFKAAEPGPNGSVIYVSIMDPALKDADYSVSDILAEVFPAEGLALYKTYSGAFGQPAQNILNLALLSNLAQ